MVLYIASVDGPHIDHSIPDTDPESFSSSDIRAMLLLHGEECETNGCHRRAFFKTLRDYREARLRARRGRD